MIDFILMLGYMNNHSGCLCKILEVNTSLKWDFHGIPQSVLIPRLSNTDRLSADVEQRARKSAYGEVGADGWIKQTHIFSQEFEDSYRYMLHMYNPNLKKLTCCVKHS